jgi:prepilin peptidase CpaA
MEAGLIGDAGRWVFIAAVTALALNDIVSFRIPNWANAALAAGFFVVAGAAALAGADVRWLAHLSAGALMFAGGLLLFQFRAMGGGDVKLLSAAALWVGMNGLLPFLVVVGLAGGGLAILLLMLRKHMMPLVAWASPRVPQSWPRVLTAGEKVPYGVAIAVGAILVALQGKFGLFGI